MLYRRRDEVLAFLKNVEATLENTTSMSHLTCWDAIEALPKPKRRDKPPTEGPGTDSNDHATEPEPTPQRHKSQKQVMRELHRMNEKEQKVEKQANGQLVVIVEKLSRKVKAAWPEFPDHLTAHGRALSELAERLKLNTAQN